MKFSNHLEVWRQSIGHYLRISWLPITLVIIFVFQNHFFNFGLHLQARDYFIRRTMVTGALGVALFGPALLFSSRTRYYYLLVVSLLVSWLFVFQFLYFSYSRGFLQASAFLYAGEGISTVSTALTFVTARLLVFVLGLLIVVVAWFFSAQGKITTHNLIKREKLIIGTVIIILTLFGYGYVLVREQMNAGNLNHIYDYSRLYDVNALVNKVGIINFTIGDFTTAIFTSDEVTAADIGFVKTYNFPVTSTISDDHFGALKGKNLILIQVESLEAAVIGRKISGQEITPRLNELVKDGLYYPNYYAPIGPGTTADAEFTILNSLYSLPDTVAFIKYPYNNYQALPSLLSANGYHTYTFHGDVSSFWNRANIYPRLGYEQWFDREDYVIGRKVGPYDLADKDFFEQSITKLQSLPQPFMASLMTLSSHTPFELPKDLVNLRISTTTNLSDFQKNYLESIHYVDEAIGEFIDRLKQVGLYDNSLILIYGDHGSFTKISSALSVSSSVFADLNASQVPLIILAPGTDLKGTRTLPGSHLDIYPTVADLFGITTPKNIFGHNIVDGHDSVAVNRSLVSGAVTSVLTEKLAYHYGSDGKFESGTCLQMPEKKKISVEDCRALFEQQSQAVKTSDLMVKGNMVNETDKF